MNNLDPVKKIYRRSYIFFLFLATVLPPFWYSFPPATLSSAGFGCVNHTTKRSSFPGAPNLNLLGSECSPPFLESPFFRSLGFERKILRLLSSYYPNLQTSLFICSVTLPPIFPCSTFGPGPLSRMCAASITMKTYILRIRTLFLICFVREISGVKS